MQKNILPFKIFQVIVSIVLLACQSVMATPVSEQKSNSVNLNDNIGCSQKTTLHTKNNSGNAGGVSIGNNSSNENAGCTVENENSNDIVDSVTKKDSHPNQDTDSDSKKTASNEQTPDERGITGNLRAKIDPLFNIDYDFGVGIVAIAQDSRSNKGDPESLQTIRTDMSDSINVKLLPAAELYLKTSYEFLEGSLGASVGFYFKNATGIASQFWAQVGILPMKGTEISSVRYFNSLTKAKNTKGYDSAPLKVTELYNWQQGENVSYKSKGGVIFVVGAGVGLFNLTRTSIAQGTWETYIEKIDATHVYVKITKSKLNAYSIGSGSFLASFAVQDFKNSDDGFSYLIDIQEEVGRKVYEDLVRGNVAAAQINADKISQNSILKSAVQKVETFKRISKGKGFNVFFGLPIILNSSTSRNKIQSTSMTDLHIEDNRINAEFGMYNLITETRAFGNHTITSKSFHSVRYAVADLKSGQLKESGELGRFSWMYQDDSTSTKSLKRSLNDLINQTGLKPLRLNIPDISEEMDFSNISLNISMSSAVTKQMMDRISRVGLENIFYLKDQEIHDEFSKSATDNCNVSILERSQCENTFKLKTLDGIKKMKIALDDMKRSRNNNAGFTTSFAEFGKAALTNQLTLQMALKLAGKGVQLNLALEGTYIDPVRVNLVSTNKTGEFIQINSKNLSLDQFLDPQLKHSRYYGTNTNKN